MKSSSDIGIMDAIIIAIVLISIGITITQPSLVLIGISVSLFFIAIGHFIKKSFKVTLDCLSEDLDLAEKDIIKYKNKLEELEIEKEKGNISEEEYYNEINKIKISLDIFEEKIEVFKSELNKYKQKRP